MTTTGTRQPGDRGPGGAGVRGRDAETAVFPTPAPRPSPSPANPSPGPRADPATVLLPRLPAAESPAAPATSTPPQDRARHPVPPPPPPVPRRWRWYSPVLATLAVALLPLAAATTDLDALDGWGLAKVLGPAAWAALACAVGGVRRGAALAAAPDPDAGHGDRGARAVQHRDALGRATGGPVHHVVRDRRVRRRLRRRRRPTRRHRRPLLLARVLRAVGLVPRRGRGHRPRRGAALVPAGGGAGLGHRDLRAGPLDAGRHPGAVGGGVAVRRPQLDRAGLLLAAGRGHRADAHGAHVRARPAGHPAHGRRGGAGLARAASGRAATAAAASLARGGVDAAQPADAAPAAAAADLLLRRAVPWWRSPRSTSSPRSRSSGSWRCSPSSAGSAAAGWCSWRCSRCRCTS